MLSFGMKMKSKDLDKVNQSRPYLLNAGGRLFSSVELGKGTLAATGLKDCRRVVDANLQGILSQGRRVQGDNQA